MGVNKIIRLPDLGEGVVEGEILKVKVSEGQEVQMDQILLEVMTDKASMEIPSSIEGKIQKIKAAEGDIVPVGAELFVVQVQQEDGAEKGPTPAQEPSKKAEKPAPKKNGPKPAAPLKPSASSKKAFPLAAPATRKLASELGLSVSEVSGSGPNGEIKREDLLSHVRSRLKFAGGKGSSSRAAVPLSHSIASSITPSITPAITSAIEGAEGLKREPLRGLKRLMFESMTLSKAQIPHFTIGGKARMDRLMQVRGEIKVRLAKQGVKTGLLPFFIKALLPVLREFPLFNSFYSAETREIVFRKSLDIGFAVDSPQGLLVPVLKSAQDKSLFEIIKEISALADQARLGQIKREDLKGAGITVSNLGSIGGSYGTPIINPPETAILGIYSLFNQVMKNKNGDWENAAFVNISLTCDHRFIDGAMSARFLKSFTEKIEDPGLILLG